MLEDGTLIADFASKQKGFLSRDVTIGKCSISLKEKEFVKTELFLGGQLHRIEIVKQVRGEWAVLRQNGRAARKWAFFSRVVEGLHRLLGDSSNQQVIQKWQHVLDEAAKREKRAQQSRDENGHPEAGGASLQHTKPIGPTFG